ncbi:MAG TPA: hypothetical protein VLL52_23495, partial [Anaerolineae bacterium]|nr:hypothetical protein [Anaerolineae bacterium]
MVKIKILAVVVVLLIIGGGYWQLGLVESSDERLYQLQTKEVGGVMPSAPKNIMCNGQTASNVHLKWYSGDDQADLYYIYRSDNGGSFTEIGTTTETEYFDEPPTPFSNRYDYYVKAYRNNDMSYSEPSPTCTNPRVIEREHFRLFYSVEGLDNCPPIDNFGLVVVSCLPNNSENGENVYATYAANMVET